MSSIVVPGQSITAEIGYLRGHGSFIETSDDQVGEQDPSLVNSGSNPGSTRAGAMLISSVAGQIERIDKLISVRPIKSRYVGEVGDLVCGRIVAVESKRWKVDISAQKDGNLQLSSVNLPGGVQRMRTQEDQLQMRTLYKEGDLISAEIQNIGNDGSISLHTRSLKYGKLENGQLVVVPATLVPRLPQHYFALPWGLDVLLGKNGYIWIARSASEEWVALEDDADGVNAGRSLVPRVEVLQRLRQKHATTAMLSEDRLKVARARNSIQLLSKVKAQITKENICRIYERSSTLQMHPRDMLQADHALRLIEVIGQ